MKRCGGCGAEERWLIHNVRHRGAYRGLCTNCLLKQQEGLFCPFCFQVYEDPLPPESRAMCLKCPSISHLSCIPPSYPRPSFLCPSCSLPNFTFFSTSNPQNATPPPLLRPDSARALVAAAKLAALSMTKAAAVARIEAERRVKEATLAKKRAREALERLTYLAAKEKDIKDRANAFRNNNNSNKRVALLDANGSTNKPNEFQC